MINLIPDNKGCVGSGVTNNGASHIADGDAREIPQPLSRTLPDAFTDLAALERTLTKFVQSMNYSSALILRHCQT